MIAAHIPMRATIHQVRHVYQHTNTSCGQACLSMLLSHYGIDRAPAEILDAKNVYVDDQGHPWGTMAADLAAWCIPFGFKAEVHTFDPRVIDHSWSVLPGAEILAKLEAVRGSRVIPTLGKNISSIFVQAYIDLLRAGGTLRIAPYVTSSLLYALLERGPLQATVCMGAFYGLGKQRVGDDGRPVLDDHHGGIGTHFVVVYGHDDSGHFLIADPSKRPGLYTVEPDKLIGSIMAAQRDCENIVFQLLR